MRRFSNFIDGNWLEFDQATISVEDPSTGEVIGSIPDSTADEVDAAVAAPSPKGRGRG